MGPSKVLVVGPAYLDVVATKLPRWPELGEELFTERVELAVGGFGIPAVALRRLGIPVLLAAPLGEDGPGFHLAALLAAEGVDRVGQVVPRTPVTVALNRADDRAFVTAGQPEEDALKDAGWKALASGPALWLHLSCRGPWAESIAERAHSMGLHVSLDCGLNAEWLGSSRFREVLKNGDIYLPNAREATCVTGRKDPLQAATELGNLIGHAIVKLGPDGVLSVKDGKVRHHPTPRRDVTDATGAGDVFDAGYIAGHLYGFSEEDAIRLGQFAAGESLQALGGATAVPRREECEERLADLPWPKTLGG